MHPFVFIYTSRVPGIGGIFLEFTEKYVLQSSDCFIIGVILINQQAC